MGNPPPTLDLKTSSPHPTHYLHGYSSLDILSGVACGELVSSPTSDYVAEGRTSAETDLVRSSLPDLSGHTDHNALATSRHTYSRTPLPPLSNGFAPGCNTTTVVRIESQTIESSTESLSVSRSMSRDKLPISKPIRKPAKGNTWKSRSQPSRFCHICSRTSKKVGLVACKNVRTGSCRKVVCEKCFAEYGWNWEAAVQPDSNWSCTHCNRICPTRAQCAIYKRTNERRREQQQQSRAQMENLREMEVARMRDQEGMHRGGMSAEFYGIVRRAVANNQYGTPASAQDRIMAAPSEYYTSPGHHNRIAYH